MKAVLRKNKVKLIILAIFLVLVLIAAIFLLVSYMKIRTMTISIDREKVDYVVISVHDLGPVTVSYSENQEALNDLFDILSGEYKYDGMWKLPNTVGVGADVIFLYDDHGELIDRISIERDGRVLVNTMYSARTLNKIIVEFCHRPPIILSYRQVDGQFDLNNFNDYLDENFRDKVFGD